MQTNKLLEVLGSDNYVYTCILSNKYNTLDGLNIIQEITKENPIQGAEHDIIYSVNIEDLENITLFQAEELRSCGFFIGEGEEYLAVYV